MSRARQFGLTLVELVIAMVIGLVLIGATASVYIANKETYRTGEIVARMQENGRIALHVIADDLKMAGFLGNNSNPSLIARRRGATDQFGALPVTDDCADRWYVDLDSLLVVGNNQPPVVDSTSFADRCLAGQGYQPTTDVIALKRADIDEIRDDDVGSPEHDARLLLRTDLVRGEFFLGGEPLPAGMNDGLGTNRRWLAHVYFIAPDAGTGIPELTRLDLGRGPEFNAREIVPGVQDLQVQLGIDTDGDGMPDKFIEPGGAPAANVIAARVWLLMRSETPEPGHNDSLNTYEYAGKRYIPGDPGTDNGTEVAANPEQYRRLLLNATVMLRNKRN